MPLLLRNEDNATVFLCLLKNISTHRVLISASIYLYQSPPWKAAQRGTLGSNGIFTPSTWDIFSIKSEISGICKHLHHFNNIIIIIYIMSSQNRLHRIYSWEINKSMVWCETVVTPKRQWWSHKRDLVPGKWSIFLRTRANIHGHKTLRPEQSVWQFADIYLKKKKKQQGKSEGFDSCDRPSNLTQTGFKSSIFQPVWPWYLMDDPKKQ